MNIIIVKQLLFAALFLLAGCAKYGAHHHYIISHDEVETVEPVR